MRVEARITYKFFSKEAVAATHKAAQLGLRDTIVAVHRDAVRGSPHKTGYNRRSIASEVSGMGTVIRGTYAEINRMVNDSGLEAVCYSTSGYGGYLETGTWKMAARPYFRPALDMHKGQLASNIKRHMP